MQMVKVLNSFFHTTGWGVPVETFKGGQMYAVDEKSMRQVALQNAVLVDVDDEVPGVVVAMDGEPGEGIQISGATVGGETLAPVKPRKGKGA